MRICRRGSPKGFAKTTASTPYTFASAGCSKPTTALSWTVPLPEDRIVITCNVDDFVRFARARELHPGIVLVKDGDLLRPEQLQVVRAAVATLQGERDLVNRVLRISGSTGRRSSRRSRHRSRDRRVAVLAATRRRTVNENGHFRKPPSGEPAEQGALCELDLASARP
jgi:hypothetical protein